MSRWKERKIVAYCIRECPVGKKFKLSKENTIAKLQPIFSHHPMDLLKIDFIGPLPAPRRQNRNILSTIDHFSKFLVAMPTAQLDRKTVLECLIKKTALNSEQLYEFFLIKEEASFRANCENVVRLGTLPRQPALVAIFILQDCARDSVKASWVF
jgi:hypothetical protein